MKLIASFAVLLLCVAGCGKHGSDPLVAVGEQALAGTYMLDNVLLKPGRVIRLNAVDPTFDWIGDTLERAAEQGVFSPTQVATLHRGQCTMRVDVDHTFAITNLPVADFTKTVSISGRWSLAVYRAFETYGYRITMNGSPSGVVVFAKFFNADKPKPLVLEIFCQQGESRQVVLRFARINSAQTTEPQR